MASSPCGGGGNFECRLEIKTRSVEQTLIPLVSQVSFVSERPVPERKVNKPVRGEKVRGPSVYLSHGLVLFTLRLCKESLRISCLIRIVFLFKNATK